MRVCVCVCVRVCVCVCAQIGPFQQCHKPCFPLHSGGVEPIYRLLTTSGGNGLCRERHFGRMYPSDYDVWTLDALRPVNREGSSYQGKTKCTLTTSTHSDSLLDTRSTVEDFENLLTVKLNESGRQKLGRYRSPVSRHSIKSYILAYYRFRKRRPLIALG